MTMQTSDLIMGLKKLVLLKNRTPHSTKEDFQNSFCKLMSYRDGGVYIAKFQGTGGWEKHPNEEFLYVLEGSSDLFLDYGGTEKITLTAGMVAVVPSERWHRFSSEEGVVLLTISPQPTEHKS